MKDRAGQLAAAARDRTAFRGVRRRGGEEEEELTLADGRAAAPALEALVKDCGRIPDS